MDSVRSADGTAIAFEHCGAGRPLVLVDPAGAYHGQRPMADVVPLLASEFTVVTYDRRGRGRSGDSDRYAVEREVEDLAAVVETVAPAAVYGFSSGAVLALHAAAVVPMTRLVVFEPALDLDAEPGPDPLDAEIATLIAAGRRGDAIVHFNRSIGVPEEYIDDLLLLPQWPELEALAHTLRYDTLVTDSMTADVIERIATPTLVLSSSGSPEPMQSWARRLAATLPNARHLELRGGWHGVDAPTLAVALAKFLRT